ncbi:MAG: hypothetical protein MI861_08520 [Pirellulales bacterium]|nr:hypothetical protein [Pirellulales bacterium]
MSEFRDQRTAEIAVRAGDSGQSIALQSGMTPFRTAAQLRLADGQTTVEELIRHLPEETVVLPQPSQVPQMFSTDRELQATSLR